MLLKAEPRLVAREIAERLEITQKAVKSRSPNFVKMVGSVASALPGTATGGCWNDLHRSMLHPQDR